MKIKNDSQRIGISCFFFVFFATGKKRGSVPPLFSHDSHRIDISHFFLLEKVKILASRGGKLKGYSLGCAEPGKYLTLGIAKILPTTKSSKKIQF